MEQIEEHKPILAFSTDGRSILHHHRVSILRAAANYVDCARLEAESTALYHGRLEATLRLHVHNELSAYETVRLWKCIKRSVPSLSLICSWVVWGEYEGCILELE